ncbi:MAG: SRPBCC family protein [Bacteroidota bacterium]
MSRSPSILTPNLLPAPFLPKDLYQSMAIFSRMREDIFAKSWQCVGMNSHFQQAGIVQPFLLMEDLLDEPLLMICDEQKTLHCLSNVCPQCGSILLRERNQLTELRCPQDGSRYSLQGQCLEIAQSAEPPQTSDHLPMLNLRGFGDLLFTGVTASTPFEQWIQPITDRTGKMAWSKLVHEGEYSHSIHIEANWTLYVDHVLTQRGDGIKQHLLAEGVMHLRNAKSDAPIFDLPDGHPDRGQSISAMHCWLWPNLLLDIYPWGVVVRIIDPIAPSETRIRSESFLWHPDLLDPLFAELLHHAELDRASQLESQQRGMQSRLFRGKHPAEGSAMQHFHKMLMTSIKQGSD